MNELNPNQNAQNKFDGRIVTSTEIADHTGVEAVLNPGDLITATDPIGGDWGGAPVMASIKIGDEGVLSIVKIDIDNPKVRGICGGQIPFEKYEGMMGGHSLVTVWTPKGKPSENYFSDVMAGTGIRLPGRDEIKGGKNGTKFYRWGDNEMRTDRARNPVTLEDIPEKFVNLVRNLDGSVTIQALEEAKDVKVHVAATREHEEVIGEKWADEIEADRKPISKRLAGYVGSIASRLVERSQHKR